MFVIFNGNHFYVGGEKELKYNCTRFFDSAKKYNTIEDAQEDIKKMSNQIKAKGIWDIIEENEIEKNCLKKLDVDNFKNEIKYESQLDEYFNNLKKYKTELVNELNYKEKEQDDILHFCEFYKYDENKSEEFYNSLREIRLRRRFLKDEIFKINKILNISSQNERRYFTSKTSCKLFLNKNRE